MSWLEELMKAEPLIYNLPDPIIEYRIYYDNQGNIIECSMQNHREGNDYIVVNKNEYDNYFRYTIKDKKLVLIEIDRKYNKPMKKTDQGFVTVKNHAGLLLEANETYNDIDNYARTDN